MKNSKIFLAALLFAATINTAIFCVPSPLPPKGLPTTTNNSIKPIEKPKNEEKSPTPTEPNEKKPTASEQIQKITTPSDKPLNDDEDNDDQDNTSYLIH